MDSVERQVNQLSINIICFLYISYFNIVYSRYYFETTFNSLYKEPRMLVYVCANRDGVVIHETA